MADQTNAEVSDERLPDLQQRLVTALYGPGVWRSDTVEELADALIAVATRRSVTSQASEGAAVAWVAYSPDRHLTHITTDAGAAAIWREQGVELEEVTGLTYFAASPSKRVERLETATIDEIIEQCAARVERFPLVSKNVPAAIRALKGGAA